MTMWALSVLCCVVVSHGVQGWYDVEDYGGYDDTEVNITGTTNTDATAPYPDAITVGPDNGTLVPSNTTGAPCGGRLHSTRGSFFSPNYPKHYPNNAQCTWYIRPDSSSSQIIELSFPYLNVEGYSNCFYDAIYVYDGSSTSSRLLGRLCGRQATTFHTTGSYLTVRFESDRAVNRGGFQASYRVVDGGSCRYNCGYKVGNCYCSSSCQYYGNCCYDYNTHCQSNATTARPPTSTTALMSHCRYSCGYNLVSCSCSRNCRYYGDCCYDYNTVCPLATEVPLNDTTEQPLPQTAQYCGGSLYGNGTFSSPNYPDQYYNNANCIWKLTADYNQTVSLSFIDLELENWSDWIAIYDGPSVHYPNLGIVSQKRIIQSSSRYMTVRFRTDSSVVRRGFYAEFTSTSQPISKGSCIYNCGNKVGDCDCSNRCPYYGNCCYDYNTHCQSTSRTEPPQLSTPVSAQYCGGPLFAPLFGIGTFSSPNYPGQYYNNANCTWMLIAYYSGPVSLSITDLQLENCCDSIDIFDGPSVNYPYLGKVSQNNMTIQSSSQYMTVRFRTDGSVVGRGFTAEFRSISRPVPKGRVDCSSGKMNIVIERSYLNSVGYDGYNLYLNDQHCRPTVSRNQVVFDFPLNTCGTELKVENGAKMMYTNAVRAYTSSYGEVTQQSYFRLNVACGMEQDMMVQSMYRVHEPINGSITGTGRFNGSMAFYRSFNSSDQVTEFPYKVALNENVYVQVNLLNGNDTGLVIFPYTCTCVASPSPDDFQSRSYDLVRNGCARDNSYHDLTAGSHSFARFTFKSFKFLRAHEMVYLQCKVLICPASDNSSRCRRGCRSRKARDLASDHDSHTMVLGPFQLKDTEQDGGTSKVEIEA